MAKFNRTVARASGVSPVTSAGVASTHEGGLGFTRDAKSELFLLAVANMVGEATFYESAGDRDSRFAELVHAVALQDVDWLGRFIPWLRAEANLRSASLVAAAEAVKARLAAGAAGGNRALIRDACRRADEPGELLAYWTSRYGRALPKPVKRGLADAVAALYNERSLLKYDTETKGYRFGDVIDLVHPTAAADKPDQGELFAHALDRRHQRDKPISPRLAVLRAREQLMSLPVEARRDALLADGGPARLRAAGMTWEALAGWLQGPLDAAAWEAIIPSMGYMACLAAGTPVWLADGTTAPIEDVVAHRLPVLSFDKEWDTRPVKYGANQGPRDHSVGALVPTVPSAWLDMGVRPVASIRFASGRTVTATYDHRWVRQRRGGRQSWEWTTTVGLRIGDRIPVPLTASCFGDEGDALDGYFVGAMLGDGAMTSVTPEFHGDPGDGATAFMREYAAKHGCGVTEHPNGRIVRMRFPFQQWKRNPLAEVLRRYEVWGKRCEVKALPNRPFSREFWIGALSGLIDTDGCVRSRVNPKGTLHGSVEYATVSRQLAQQVCDAMLRLGVTSILRERPVRASSGAIQHRHCLFIVEVNRATAIVQLAGLLDLRIGYKAKALAELVERIGHVRAARSEMHGYDERVALDRVVAIEDAGEEPTYCVTVDTSSLFVANGIVTGNCLRNLRNFDQAGVSDTVAATIAAKLADPDEVAASRQLPFRFLSAYRAAPSLRWAWALEQALGHALAGLPELGGSTLILVDTSGSMHAGFSRDGTLMRWDAAALFGIALAARARKADLVSFSNGTKPFSLKRGESVLAALARWKDGGWFLNGGTNTAACLRASYGKHDRVVIVTDEQAAYDPVSVTASVPAHVPIYTWNLAGYRVGHAPSGGANRHTFGGLNDQAFRMIPLLEERARAGWPF